MAGMCQAMIIMMLIGDDDDDDYFEGVVRVHAGLGLDPLNRDL